MSKVQVIPAVPAFDIDDICTQLSSFVDESKPSGVTKKKLEYYTDIFKSREHCEEPKRILVYGRPGIGKTVFTQKTTFDWSQKRKEKLSTFDLVLLVKLDEVCDLPDVPAILKASEVFAIDSKISDDLYEYICHNEGKIKVLLILDGFDKYSAGKQSPILDIWKRKLLRDCCVIITTSDLTGDLRSHSDCEFEISGFDTDDQIRTFAKKFLSDEIKVEELLKCLKEHHLEDMVKIPLLLAMLCESWEKNTEKSSSLGLIYTHFIKTLAAHKSAKDTDAEVSREEGCYEEELCTIGELAFDALLQGILHLSLSEIPRNVFEKLRDLRLVQVSNVSRLNPEKGVFFIHKSLQEFLAAWYLKDELLSAKRVSPSPLLKIGSIEKIFNMSEVLKFAAELSKEDLTREALSRDPVWDIVSHLGDTAKKEGLTEYHFSDVPSENNLTRTHWQFHRLILDVFFCCSPDVKRQFFPTFLSYVGCGLIINPDQLQTFAEEHLLKSTTLPNYVFMSAESLQTEVFSTKSYPEQYHPYVITVLEDVNAIVVGCSGEKRASDFLKKYPVKAVDYLLCKREERVYLHIVGIHSLPDTGYPFPIEMLKGLVAPPERTQQEEPPVDLSGEQDNTENTAHNSSPTRHCLSLASDIGVKCVGRSEVETLTNILPFVTRPESIDISGDKGEIMLDAELTKSLVSSIRFTDRLDFICLDNMNLTADSVAIITSSLHQARYLRFLYLQNNPLGEGVSVLTQHLSIVPHLEELLVDGVKMTKKQVNDLATAVRQSNIRLMSDYHVSSLFSPI